MKNTPIQELIDLARLMMDNCPDKTNQQIIDLFIDYMTTELEKEKAFAFDCFEAGKNYVLESYVSYVKDHPNFEQFYLQYSAEQHKQ